jgi:hypothetical protein
MFERFTERARQAIFHARYEALARGSNAIEPKDIVLGLTWDPHQPDCPFAKIHDNSDELRRLIGPERTVYGPPQNRDIGLSLDSKKALAYAASESEYDQCHSIESDHLLRGILRNGGELANKMASIGYTLLAMRKDSEQAHISSGRERLSVLKKRNARYRTQVRTAAIVAVVVFVFVIAISYLVSQN